MSNLVLDSIQNEIRESYKVKQKLLEDFATVSTIHQVAQKCIEVYGRGNKTLIAGNGGSASDAQHMAAELSGRFNFDRPGIPSIALTGNTSMLTAIGNDYGYDRIFSRQVQANGVLGDLFIGISTSGKSLNIVRAVEACKEKGVISVGLTGMAGNRLAELCDYCIRVPSSNTARIQECHILIIHIICSVVEEALFGEARLLHELV
ncbi:D-sedoheptulose-7-phosphate isomerase [Leptolyngbya sp. AN03gr2]|uniref:D-sedoheptulose-7-phosphate isomerase n=1 Tax=unclassified Leptolyngbya TaxID=2650499 RepID=UPI003D323AAE